MNGMQTPHLITLILHFGRLDDTLACLQSLKKSTYSNNQVMVLDASPNEKDRSAIVQTYPDTQIVKLEHNRGYAGNNTVGLIEAIKYNPDWILLLNDDTVLSPDCISKMVQVGENNPQIGVLGPTVYHFDTPDVIQSAGGILTPRWDSQHLNANEQQLSFDTPHPVDWISGCALLIRGEVIKQIGYLDERFYLYWEEVDWCLRARESGWEIWHVPDAKIWHKGAQPHRKIPPAVTYYSTRNHFLLLYKHNAPLSAKVYTWLQAMRTLTSWSIRPKWRDKKEDRNAMWRGVIDFLRGRFGPMTS